MKEALDKIRAICDSAPAIGPTSIVMEECECCGMEILPEAKTTPCPECGKMRCESCDMGCGTVCSECEEAEGERRVRDEAQ